MIPSTSTPQGNYHCQRWVSHVSAPAIGVLQSSRPIDRLRYQAKLIFDTFDKDADGKLSVEDIQAYFQFSEEKFGRQKLILDLHANTAEKISRKSPESQQTDFEEFVDLVRGQVAAAAEFSKEWLPSQIPGKELSNMLFAAALTIPEMARVLAIFKLLDRDSDGFLKLSDLHKAQGIEKKVVVDVLEDADDNEDGLLSFSDFLTSYHKKRTVFLTMAVMLAHSACFWLIFNLPIDSMLKVVLSGLLVMKPQVVTGPVTKIWQIGKAVVGRFIATREMAAKGASWSSIA
ncbi:hypothetical protein CEUSTIGMA_g9669.t1 [Chlamydomonas eustigma]|uniref:EF-hand domain-containing protein n=1 Tax=Chlamydomonas eustigma TaxID=1157962 RepID=A0A250XGN5_9CHLO|nr:hypothetical protein CEUSTIGMA_g9669.t1 [Chlamydomonas eustigma]|eukprot:GAX82241.1 hypothetical protein CEUSTIGMA_g9669.t1 [Chlamydomonas eustigma]